MISAVAQVWISDVGIIAVIAGLYAWASTFGFWHMAALYLGPLAFTNCWLVLYTWLQVSLPSPRSHARAAGARLSLRREYEPHPINFRCHIMAIDRVPALSLQNAGWRDAAAAAA